MTTLTTLRAVTPWIERVHALSTSYENTQAMQDEIAELRTLIAAMEKSEPVGEITAEDMGAPFNAISIRTHFYKEVPTVGTKLYTNQQPSVDAVEWAVGRWIAEVQNRPLVNVHRRSLDDTWRTVIRHFGGDDSKLLPLPRHDDMVTADRENSRANVAASEQPVEQPGKDLEEAYDEIACAEAELEAWSCELPEEMFNQGFDCLGEFIRAIRAAIEQSAQPVEQPLSDEQIEVIAKPILDRGDKWEGLQPWVFQFTRAIEQAIRSKQA